MTLYYKYVYMPPVFSNMPERTFKSVLFSPHAFEALEDEGISMYDDVTFSGKNILEAETNEKGLLKTLTVEIDYPDEKNKNIIIVMGISRDKFEPNKIRDVHIITNFLSWKDKTSIINKAHQKYYRPANMSFEREG
jgi:hypothetical protein